MAEINAQEARAMVKMAKDMALLEAIMTSLEQRPTATLETIGTPEYEAAYQAWEVENDKVMALVRARNAERKAE